VMLPDIAALREILSDEQAIYFERGSVEGMLGAIETVYREPTEADRRARAARLHVQQYT
jgi:hypothetical protein